MPKYEFEILDENVNFLLDLYFKKLEIIKDANALLISRANFLFAVSTGFFSVAAFWVDKYENAMSGLLFHELIILLFVCYIITLFCAFKAYKTKGFYFDPDFAKLCQKFGDKNNIEMKKQLIANGAVAIIKNEKIISSTGKYINVGLVSLSIELILMIIVIFII